MAKLFNEVENASEVENEAIDADFEEFEEEPKKGFHLSKKAKITAIVAGGAAIIGGIFYAIGRGSKSTDDEDEHFEAQSTEESVKELEELEENE